jgi:hypothetical protein
VCLLVWPVPQFYALCTPFEHLATTNSSFTFAAEHSFQGLALGRLPSLLVAPEQKPYMYRTRQIGRRIEAPAAILPYTSFEDRP